MKLPPNIYLRLYVDTYLIKSIVVNRVTTAFSLFKFKHDLPFTLFLVCLHPNVAMLPSSPTARLSIRR